MVEEEKFPLIIWEESEEFEKEYEEAKKRFQDVYNRLDKRGFGCTYLGNLRMDNEGYPEVWLNDHKDIYRNNWTIEEAKIEALENGDTGWWSLDELEEFVEGKGFIFEEAMYDLGFRKHKKDPEKWARKTKGDEEPHSRRWNIKNKKQLENITGEELERLNKLWTFPNSLMVLDNTYSLEVGKRGFVFAHLNYNPFYSGPAGGLNGYYGPRMRARGHFAKEQKGFNIDAKNIQLVNEKGIYIKAIKPDKTFVERIWPIRVMKDKIYDLAKDLVSRATEVPVTQKPIK